MRDRIEKIGNYALLFLLMLGFATCNSDNNTEELVIATSANMQFAMKELVLGFEEKYGIETSMVVSSSGALTSQIIAGAPYDLFFSADKKYPRAVYAQGFAATAPFDYAQGRIALVVKNEVGLKDVFDLDNNRIQKIAIPDPKLAPYGEATIQFFEKNSIFESIESKIIFAKSVTQASHFITSKAVDAAITSLSFVRSPKFVSTQLQYFPIPITDYSPIQQSGVILKSASQDTKSKQFVEYLNSDAGDSILEKFGYLPL